MINENIQLHENILNTYRAAIYNFEAYLYKIYYNNNIPNNIHRGYLVNLKDFDEIKNLIDYNHYKMDIHKNNYIYSNINERITKIKQIKFKNTKYLANMLFNDNKYILINNDLWKILCEKGKENEPPIMYEIHNTHITFNLDGLELEFNYDPKDINKNIIDINSFNLKDMYKSSCDIII